MEKTDSGYSLSEKPIAFLALFIPAAYFFKSRFKDFSTFIFHACYEWLPGAFCIYSFSKYSYTEAAFAYFNGFLAFIALYEIGYFVNDYYAVKKESNPRLRVSNFHLADEWEVLLLITARVLFFFGLLYFTSIGSLTFLFFCFLLCVVFAVHNFLQVPGLKFLTFIGLALFRFLLPLIPFVHLKQLQVLLPAILVNYVLYRMINYMESKGILQIPNRKAGWYKFSFYLLLLPVNLFVSVVFESNFPFWLNLYFLAFWSIYFLKSKYFSPA